MDEVGGTVEQSDDVGLLRAAAFGDPAAVERLLDEVGPVVYGFVHARVGGDEAAAADLVQETLLEAVRSAGGFRGEAALATWVCTIARRRVARYYERERRQEAARRGLRALPGGDEEPTTPAAPEQEIDGRDEVIRALGALPALHRQVLVLKYLDDRSVEEIASELGKGRTQVQSLLQRARDGLRRSLETTRADG